MEYLMPDQTPATRLWEIDHPYYATDGDYYSRGQHSTYDSWAEFTELIFHSGDRDMNLLYRWDWHKPGWHDHVGTEYLALHFVLQRKAICCSVDVRVTEADEPAVRMWLAECARTMTELWQPLNLGEVAQ